jgi:hypothetical protein
MLGWTTKLAIRETASMVPANPKTSTMELPLIFGVTKFIHKPAMTPPIKPKNKHAPILYITSQRPPTIIPPQIVPMIIFYTLILPKPVSNDIT